MTPASIATLCLALIGYGLLKRLTQAALYVLNHGRRSE
jgi:hypothetical protein